MRSSYLVCYDISNDKRLRQVFKTMRGYGDHLQYSVFECQLTSTDLISLRISFVRSSYADASSAPSASRTAVSRTRLVSLFNV